jgi:hypothetical protein
VLNDEWGYLHVFDTKRTRRSQSSRDMWSCSTRSTSRGMHSACAGSFSLDGKYCYPSDGSVVDCETGKKTYEGCPEREASRVEFRNGKAVRNGHRAASRSARVILAGITPSGWLDRAGGCRRRRPKCRDGRFMKGRSRCTVQTVGGTSTVARSFLGTIPRRWTSSGPVVHADAGLPGIGAERRGAEADHVTSGKRSTEDVSETRGSRCAARRPRAASGWLGYGSMSAPR